MSSVFALWWLGLPLVLLPLWWHRQKRRRPLAEALATARFLPAAAPEQLPIWRWRERLLLLLRCALLVALLAWLAVPVFPWRGDTVLVDPQLAPAWAEQQIAAAGFGTARRIAIGPEMAGGVLPWLQRHQRDWRPEARLLVVARADAANIAMPARVPRLSHALQWRLQAATKPVAAASVEHHVVLAVAPARLAAWRALFAAFETAGTGADRYLVGDTPDAHTELIVWDRDDSGFDAAPAGWRAPLWWIAGAMPASMAGAPVLPVNGLSLRHADSAHGRLWWSAHWLPQDADGAAALFDTWRALTQSGPAPAYPMPAIDIAATRGAPDMGEPARLPWLGWVLLALFLLERMATHARRT